MRSRRGLWRRLADWLIPSSALRLGGEYSHENFTVHGTILTGPAGVRADVRPEFPAVTPRLRDGRGVETR